MEALGSVLAWWKGQLQCLCACSVRLEVQAWWHHTGIRAGVGGVGRVESAQPSPATGALAGTADPIPLRQAGKFSLIPTIITLATALTSVGLVSMGAGGVQPSHLCRP